MKNILTLALLTAIIGIDYETYDLHHELITIRYDDLGPDSLIIEKKDMKNKAKIWNAIEHILNERGVYEYN